MPGGGWLQPLITGFRRKPRQPAFYISRPPCFCADYRAAVGGVDYGHLGLAVGSFSPANPWGSWRRLPGIYWLSQTFRERDLFLQSELEEINAGRDIHKNTVRENILIADRFTFAG